MKALLKVGYRCNQACRFCHREGLGAGEAGRGEIEAKIDRAARLGHRLVAFSGGEATLRPELPAWADRVAALGMDLGLLTNGTCLDEALVAGLARRRLRYVHLSLHGGDAALHDGLAGAPTFRRVLGALRALSGRGLELWVNCVVTRQNLPHLPGVLAALAPWPDAAVKFTLVEPRGGAARDFEALVPDVAEAAAAVREALALAARDGRRAAHDGLPLCLLPGLEGQRGDLRAHGFWTMSEPGEPDLFPVDEGSAVQPPRCRPCALRGRCPGLFAGYLERRGDAALAPRLGGPASNSFHYVYEGRVVPPTDGACPVRSLGPAPFHRARHLFVRHGDRVARFRTDTRDFSDAEVAAVKLGAGQVYLDASGRPALEDFARELVPLRRAEACGACPEEPRCTGLYEPRWENVFARDDARLLGQLAALEGEVLDVGCGEGPYGEALAARAAAGRIRYTGLEPMPARAARLRARWPWARVVVGTAEAAPVRAAAFDHVLVLRSWNHLRDPAAALARLLPALRPGGTLTVADNEAFGLARTPRQAGRAEGSSAAFEHYRNDGAAEAEALVAAAARGRLALLERQAVGPGTSNQWVLRYRATG